MPGIKKVKDYLKYLFALVAIFFLLKYIYKNWYAVSLYQWRFKYGLLVIAFGILGLNFLFLIQIWRDLLSRFSYKLPFRKAFKIWSYSNLGKYVPGKIWSVMGMVYMCEKENIPYAATFTSAIMYQALNIIAGMILVVVISGAELTKGMSKFIYLPLALVLIVFAYPPIMEKSTNFLLKLIKREPIKVSLSFGDNIVFILLLILGWCVYGIGFNVLVSSLTDYPLGLWPYMTSAFAFSYIIGFLAIFVPGGFGVREGILISYLSVYFPLPIATIIALFSRLWMTVMEAFGFLVSTRL
ncbi:MAG: flippase-like domain-containing protein [candidate division Zixibacteria bacterium]|nr:flippase-like domain-containing protein [candidate division Zixibacteria bacterium]